MLFDLESDMFYLTNILASDSMEISSLWLVARPGGTFGLRWSGT